MTIPSSNISTIHFKYEDQVDLTQKQVNSTQFDCEAFFYVDGFLHLFTKNWKGDYTVHYTLNATNYSGVQTATRKDSLNTGRTLITAAAMLNDKAVLLLGYEVAGIPSGNLWIISDFENVNQLFETGNKRKLGLGYIVSGVNSGIGQVEGLAAAGNERVFITSEYFAKAVAGLNFTISQSLYGLGIADWLPKKAGQQTSDFSWEVSPSPFSDKLYIELFCDRDGPVHITLHDLSGRELVSKEINCSKGANRYLLDDLSSLSQSIYLVSAQSADGMLVKK